MNKIFMSFPIHVKTGKAFENTPPLLSKSSQHWSNSTNVWEALPTMSLPSILTGLVRLPACIDIPIVRPKERSYSTSTFMEKEEMAFWKHSMQGIGQNHTQNISATYVLRSSSSSSVTNDLSRAWSDLRRTADWVITVMFTCSHCTHMISQYHFLHDILPIAFDCLVCPHSSKSTYFSLTRFADNSCPILRRYTGAIHFLAPLGRRNWLFIGGLKHSWRFKAASSLVPVCLWSVPLLL